MTFFPYYLMARFPGTDVTCVDRDLYLDKLYKKTNSREYGDVTFKQCDLAQLPFDDDTFDALYCISVLEHTANRKEIAREFNRVLKPGGLAVITWDISLDGTKDIPVDDGIRLHNELDDLMDLVDAPLLDVGPDDIFSTDLESEVYTGKPWWKRYRNIVTRTKMMLSQQKLQRSRMTIYCGSFRKRVPAAFTPVK
jgi:SAM-dependent methyltransferase